MKPGHLCDVCGRKLPPQRRGRPRIRHRECSQFEAFLTAAENQLNLMRFDPATAAEFGRRIRRRLFGMVNQNLQKHQLKLAEPEGGSDD